MPVLSFWDFETRPENLEGIGAKNHAVPKDCARTEQSLLKRGQQIYWNINLPGFSKELKTLSSLFLLKPNDKKTLMTLSLLFESRKGQAVGVGGQLSEAQSLLVAG